MARLIKKEKKIDLTKYFNEEAWATITYIPREIWRGINRLTLCLVESQAFIEIQKDKRYIELQRKIEKAKENERKELLKELNELQTQILLENYKNLNEEQLKELQRIETEKNKMLVEYGVDKERHNFTDEKGQKLELNYEILKNCEFFDYIIQEIVNFNAEFDLLERR